jgi:hypothetical protein
MGHMAEAEAEAMAVYPDIAETLRLSRKKMEMEPEWMPVLLPVISAISKRVQNSAKQSCDGSCSIGGDMSREDRIASKLVASTKTAGFESLENIILAGIQSFYKKAAASLNADLRMIDKYECMLTFDPKNRDAKDKGLFFDVTLNLDIRKHGNVSVSAQIVGNSQGDHGIWWDDNKKTDVGIYGTAADIARWALSEASKIEREFMQDSELWV